MRGGGRAALVLDTGLPRSHTALRTPRGVPWASLSRPDELDGLIDEREGRAVLTVRGRLLANEVTTRIRSGSLH